MSKEKVPDRRGAAEGNPQKEVAKIVPVGNTRIANRAAKYEL
jgi:hypothetical protein